MDPRPAQLSSPPEFDLIEVDEFVQLGAPRAVGKGGAPSGEPDPEAIRQRVLGAAPSWALSLVLHLGLFAVLSLIVLQRPRPEPERMVQFAVVVDLPDEPPLVTPPVTPPVLPTPSEPTPDETGEDTAETMEASEAESLLPPAAAAPLEPAETPEGAPVPVGDPTAPTPTPAELALDAPKPTAVTPPVSASAPRPRPRPVSGAARNLAGLRSPSGRQRALGKHGGTSAGEAAVARGLDWLAHHQSRDGSWHPTQFDDECQSPTCKGHGAREMKRGLTGLALLAYLAGGHTHLGDSPYRHVVRRGIEHVLALQDPTTGTFGEVRAKYVYHHAVLTYALAEGLALTGDPNLRAPVALAVQVLVHSQQDSGGWDYNLEPTGRNDTSVTGFVLMALKAADLAEVGPPRSTWRRAARFLQIATSGTSDVSYSVRNWRPDSRATYPLRAVALLSWLYVGKRPGSAEVDGLVQQVLTLTPQEMFSKGTTYSLYSWYYTSLALFHRGGGPWEAWNRQVRDLLISQQVRHDHGAGSWDPVSAMGEVGGRVLSTALSVLTLEVYYRYHPLHEIGWRLGRTSRSRRPVNEEPDEPAEAEESRPRLEEIARATALATSEDQRERDRAVKLLAAAGLVPSAVRGLVVYLDDSDASIRWQAVVALERCEFPESVAALVERLPLEPSTSVQGRIIGALGVLGDKSVVPALVEILLGIDRSLDDKVMLSLRRLTGREGGEDSRVGWLRWLTIEGYIR